MYDDQLPARADPFDLVELDLAVADKLSCIAEIAPADDVPIDALAPRRCVAKMPDGKLALIDVAARSATMIGPDVDFGTAGEIATRVLAGDQRAVTNPLTVHTLALAYIGALVAAERRRQARGGSHVAQT